MLSVLDAINDTPNRRMTYLRALLCEETAHPRDEPPRICARVELLRRRLRRVAVYEELCEEADGAAAAAGGALRRLVASRV